MSLAEALQLGLGLYQAGRLAEADAVFTDVLAADPGNVDALHLQAIVAFQLKDPPRALGLLDQALAAGPSAARFRDRATMRQALGMAEPAVEDMASAIALQPDDPGLHLMRADALAGLGRLDAALESYDRAQALHPAAEILNRRGASLQAGGRLDEAVAAYRAAIAAEPGNAASHRGLGNALYSQGLFEEALASFEAAVALEPGNAVGHYNRGNALKVLGRPAEVLASYETAVRLAPDFAVAHHNRATSLLELGELAAGFEAYEWRKRCPSFEDPRYGGDRLWPAGADLTGKSLFVYPEFYQGDLIQFCRYARLAERRGARVTLAAPAQMHALLRSLSPTLEIVAAEAEAPGADYQAALLTLPHAFGTTLESLPEETAYLHAEPERVARWRARIGTEGFKVGVVWQGSTLPYAIPLQRSYPLAELAGVAALPGVRLISLQKVNGLDQLDRLPPGMAVETLGDDFDAGADVFLDTAAAMSCCDLVIAMDTSVAHLAGALGIRAWIALPFIADWRWLTERSDSPWYPSLRLFRQAARNDWGSVFGTMEAELRAELGGR